MTGGLRSLNSRYKSAALFLILVSLSLAWLAMPVHAAGSYSVRPHVDDTGIAADSRGADAEKPVWDASLPVLGQYAALILITSLGAGCLIPVLGRIEDALSHEKRKAIYDFIRRNPGCTVTDISEQLSMNIGTVYHHLWMLQARRKVLLESHGKFLRAYEGRLASSDKKIDRAVCAHMRNEISKRLLHAVLDRPGVNNVALAQAVSLDKSTICWYLQRLAKDGLIDTVRDGRQKLCYINDRAGAALKEYAGGQAGF